MLVLFSIYSGLTTQTLNSTNKNKNSESLLSRCIVGVWDRTEARATLLVLDLDCGGDTRLRPNAVFSGLSNQRSPCGVADDHSCNDFWSNLWPLRQRQCAMTPRNQFLASDATSLERSMRCSISPRRGLGAACTALFLKLQTLNSSRDLFRVIIPSCDADYGTAMYIQKCTGLH